MLLQRPATLTLPELYCDLHAAAADPGDLRRGQGFDGEEGLTRRGSERCGAQSELEENISFHLPRKLHISIHKERRPFVPLHCLLLPLETQPQHLLQSGGHELDLPFKDVAMTPGNISCTLSDVTEFRNVQSSLGARGNVYCANPGDQDRVRAVIKTRVRPPPDLPAKVSMSSNQCPITS